jgi:thiol-disulfide isomerase/thioredoxin
MSNRARQVRRVQARQSAAARPGRGTGRGGGRPRRRGWAVAAAAVVVIVGVVLAVHAASRPGSASGSGASGTAALPAVGQQAPGGTFTTVSGKTVSVTSMRGKPTLLWFVSTWCSSCEAGTATMAQNVSKLAADGVRVVEVELYQDLGQSGPSITDFGKTLAGANYASPDWTWGISSAALTRTYDPANYLDVYYLLNAEGTITYVNGSPAATMPQLLSQARNLA